MSYWKLEYNWHYVDKGAIKEVGGIESILGIVVPVGALETDTENWPLQYERNNAKYAETRLASELRATLQLESIPSQQAT